MSLSVPVQVGSDTQWGWWSRATLRLVPLGLIPRSPRKKEKDMVDSRQLRKWKTEAKERGALYLLVITEVIDRFDYEFKPVFCKNKASLTRAKNKWNDPGHLTAVHAVYEIE